MTVEPDIRVPGAVETYDTDVIVVGTGPMGGTTALALASYGVRVLAVSKWNWVAHSPRAHVVNQRAMEVLRDLGVEEECKATGTPWELMGDHVFATSLTGPEIARLRTWGTGDERATDYRMGSPCGLLDLGQPLMEPIVVAKAAARGASSGSESPIWGSRSWARPRGRGRSMRCSTPT